MNKTLISAFASAITFVFGVQAATPSTPWFDAKIEQYSAGATTLKTEGGCWDADWAAKMVVKDKNVVINADTEDALYFIADKTNSFDIVSGVALDTMVQFTPFSSMPEFDIKEAKAGIIMVSNETIKIFGVAYDLEGKTNKWEEVIGTGITDIDASIHVVIRIAKVDDIYKAYYDINDITDENGKPIKADDDTTFSGAQFAGCGVVSSLKGKDDPMRCILTLDLANLPEKVVVDRVVSGSETIVPEAENIYKVAVGSPATVYFKPVDGYIFSGLTMSKQLGVITEDVTVGDFADISKTFTSDTINGAAYWVDANAIKGEVGNEVVTWFDRREPNLEEPNYPCATNRWTISTTKAGYAPELQELNGGRAVWFGDKDGRWMQWTKPIDDIRHVFIVHCVNTVWGPLLGWHTTRNGGMVINTGASVVENASQYFYPRADLSSEYLGADFRRDGEGFDPFTTAPRNGQEELLSIDFTHAVSRADRFMHSTFETQYLGGKEKGTLGGGWIVEALIFTNRLTDVQVAEVEAYLKAKHSLPKSARSTLDTTYNYVRPADGVESLADGSKVARGVLHEPVEVKKGDIINASNYAPLRNRTSGTAEWDLKTGTQLTIKPSSHDRICKSGTGRAALNSFPSGVARLSVESGSLALEAIKSESQGEESFPIAEESGSVATTNFTIVANGEANTTVTLPGAGLYEISMIVQEKFGTRSNIKEGVDIASAKKFQEVDIYFDGELIGRCRALGREAFRYRFRLPYVAGEGEKAIRLVGVANLPEAETYVDGIEVNPLERRETLATFKIPNGDFEEFGFTPNAGEFVGWYNITSNTIPGWTFRDWSTEWAGAEYNASVGVVSPATTYFINSSTVDSSPVWNFAGHPYGSAALALFKSKGSAENTFTAPAGKFYLKASLARWDSCGQAYINISSQLATKKETSISGTATVKAQIVVGAITNDLGTVSVSSFLNKDFIWPNSINLDAETSVTLILSQTSESGVTIDDLALENCADMLKIKGDLVTNGDFENGSAGWSSKSKNWHENASVSCGVEYHKTSVSSYGHALRPIGNHSCWFFFGGLIYQTIDFPKAGIYRFNAHIRTRADSESYGRQRFQFWTCKNGTTATNVVAKTFAEEYCHNYREHSYYFEIPEAGKYVIGLESIGPTEPWNKNGTGNFDHSSYADDISVKYVGETLTPPTGFDMTAVDVSTNAHLILDFTGTVQVASLKLNGEQVPVGTYTATDYPEVLQGIGSIDVLACPPAPDPIQIVAIFDATGGTFGASNNEPTTNRWWSGGYPYTTNLTLTVGKPFGTLPKPSKPGFTFLGWYDLDGNQILAGTEVLDTTNITIYAKWEFPVGDQTKYPRSELDKIDLPLLVIDTVNGEEPDYGVACRLKNEKGESCNGIGISFATKVPGRMKIFRKGEEIYDTGAYDDDAKKGMTLKIRGNTSSHGSKKPYKIKLAKKSKADLLFRGNDDYYGDRDWVLLKGVTTLNTPIGFMVNEIVGLDWTPGVQPVNVIVNGDYRGLYYLTESVSEVACRNNVAEDGYLFEYDAYWWNEPTYFKISYNRYNVGFTFKYPDADGYPTESDLTDANKASLSNSVENAYYSILDGTYTNLIHTTTWAKWLLGRDILGANDGAGSNYYLTKTNDNPKALIRMANMWDFDSDYNEKSRGKWTGIHTSGYFYFNELRASPCKCFNNAYVKYFNAIKDSLATNIAARLEAKIASGEAAAIEQALVYNNARWGEGVKTFRKMMETPTAWFTNRIEWIAANINKEFATDDTPDPDIGRPDVPEEPEPVTPTDWKGDYNEPVTLPAGDYNLQGVNFNGGLILGDGAYKIKNDGKKTVNTATSIIGTENTTVYFTGKGTLKLTDTDTAMEVYEIIVSNGVIKASGTIHTTNKFTVEDAGTVEIESAGVCLKSDKKFSVNADGKFYAYSTGDHAVKCGKNAEFNGGYMLAYATAAGKCGLSVKDGNKITCTGGIAVSIGGEGSTYYGVPKNAYCLQQQTITGEEGPYLKIVAEAESKRMTTTVKLPTLLGANVTIFAYGDNWKTVTPFDSETPDKEYAIGFHDIYQKEEAIISAAGTIFYVK